MYLIDTHCHLYLEEFASDLASTVERAKQSGVQKIFLPAIDSETHVQLLALSETEQPVQLLAMIGLHPCSVKQNFEEELCLVEQHLKSDKKFWAIGEIGLDYHWDLSYRQQQLIAFEKQIDLAIQHRLPVVIHSRKSTQDCIDVVRQFPGKVSGIFHCFGGTLAEAEQIIDLGFYLGIGGVLTYKNSGLKEVVAQIGLSKLVLETDAPYLSPVPHRGKRNEPSYIQWIAETLAQTLQTSVQEVAETTTKNALQVFKMN